MFRRTVYDREILLLAAPAFGALIAEPLYVLTDRAIVGRLGTPELAGLAIASAILLSAHAILIFLAYGTTGLVGRLVGAGRCVEQPNRALPACGCRSGWVWCSAWECGPARAISSACLTRPLMSLITRSRT